MINSVAAASTGPAADSLDVIPTYLVDKEDPRRLVAEL